MTLRLWLEDVAREAGGLALEMAGRVRTERKGSSIVSEADRAVERLIVDRIRAEYPDDYILAEESGADPDGAADPGGGTYLGGEARWWAVDPIDGTLPYLSGLPFWGVSVACLRGSRPEGAAVALPGMGEMYSALAGGPSFRNGEPIPPVPPEPPGDHSALFVPCGDFEGLEIRFPGKRLSLAAVSLHFLYTAAGASFGAVSEPTRAYDIAASALILESAAGAVRYISGKEVDYAELADGRRTPEPVVAAQPDQVEWLCGQVKWSGD
jgi:myo-inositol-1(or 4)-monophosphatase